MGTPVSKETSVLVEVGVIRRGDSIGERGWIAGRLGGGDVALGDGDGEDVVAVTSW